MTEVLALMAKLIAVLAPLFALNKFSALFGGLVVRSATPTEPGMGCELFGVRKLRAAQGGHGNYCSDNGSHISSFVRIFRAEDDVDGGAVYYREQARGNVLQRSGFGLFMRLLMGIKSV